VGDIRADALIFRDDDRSKDAELFTDPVTPSPFEHKPIVFKNAFLPFPINARWDLLAHGRQVWMAAGSRGIVSTMKRPSVGLSPFERFERFMKVLVAVPKKEIDRKLAYYNRDKRSRRRKAEAKPSAAT